MQKFFSTENSPIHAEKIDNEANKCLILISSDDIFSSDKKDFEKYAQVSHFEYSLSKSYIYGEKKVTSVMLNAEEVKVTMPPGCHCAMLIGRMGKSIVMPKITIVKVIIVNGKSTILEKKEFEKCVIQTFKMENDVINFSFRYSSFRDSYNDLKHDGTQKGNAAVQVDLIKWRLDNS